MSFIGWSLTLVVLAALAFTVYYQVIIRVLHIDLKAREIHSILTPDGWRIRLFRYRKGGTSGEPVLLVHGYTSNHWNLTLPQGESLADFLVEKGYDCWAIDLRGNRTSLPPPGTPRHRATYDGYVMQDLPAAIAFIRQSTGFDQIHWTGHSMGGMLLYSYELAHGRDHIASGATLASPPWLEAFWTKTQDRLVWFMETAPWIFEILKRGFAPIFAWLKPHYSLVPVRWENMNPKFGIAEFFNAAEQTAGPVTRTFEECAKHRYLAIDNDRINVLQGLNRLQTPLLVMACPLDPIAPISNLQLFFDRLPTSDKRFIELSKAAGCAMDHSHVDPPFSRNAATEVFTPIADWIGAHPARRAKAIAEPLAEKPFAQTQKPAIAIINEAKLEILPITTAASTPSAEDNSTAWGKALKSAASILSGFDVKPATEAPTTTNGTHRRAAAKKTEKAKPVAKKTSTKTKASTKTKSAAVKSKAKPIKPAPMPASPTHTAEKRRTKAAPDVPRANGGEAAPVKPARRSTKAKSARKRSSKGRG